MLQGSCQSIISYFHCQVLFYLQVEVPEPMEDELCISYPIVIPTAAEEPLSASPTAPCLLPSKQDSRNFERCDHKQAVKIFV